MKLAGLEREVAKSGGQQSRHEDQRLGHFQSRGTRGASRAVGSRALLAVRVANGAVTDSRAVVRRLARANATAHLHASIFGRTTSSAAVSSATGARASRDIARLVVLTGQIVGALGAALVGLALLTVVRLAVPAGLAYTLPIDAIATVAAIDITSAGDFLGAHAAAESGVTRAITLAHGLDTGVRARALVVALRRRARAAAVARVAGRRVVSLVLAVRDVRADELASDLGGAERDRNIVVHTRLDSRHVGGGRGGAGRGAGATGAGAAGATDLHGTTAATRRRRSRKATTRSRGAGSRRRGRGGRAGGGGGSDRGRRVLGHEHALSVQVADLGALVRGTKARLGTAAGRTCLGVGRALVHSLAILADRDAGSARECLLAVRVRGTRVGFR